MIYAHSDLFHFSVMSSDAVKKRKPKVIRSEGGTPEAKRGRGESDQVSGCEMHSRWFQQSSPLTLYSFFFSNNSHVQLSAVSSHDKFRKVRLRQVKVQSSMFHSFSLQMSFFFNELCSDELQLADLLMWDSCGVCM